MEIVHTPVLLEETIHLLAPQELMIDATLGEGGHSYAFLSRFPNLKIIGIDADKDIQEVAKKRLEEFSGRIDFYNGWSLDFFTRFEDLNYQKPDAILIDLGISLYHYQKGNRGFSFLKDEALDMRLDKTSGVSAEDLIARLSEKDLADLIYHNGEERFSRRIARNIAEERAKGKISSSKALADIIFHSVPPSYRYGQVHPATKSFQALRIAVNQELEKLPTLLEASYKVLKTGGRIGVISFHSLEDRIVKNFFREKDKSAPIHKQEAISFPKKGVVPSAEEITNNPRARSARLRVAEKKDA